MGRTVNFDRAAGFYDATRSESPDTTARFIDLLFGELRGAGRVLEVGVGTGRVALPLARRGVNLTGVDISAGMLGQLVAARGDTALPVVLSDARRLPFADGSFEAAVVAHVLHLVEDWELVAEELLRVTSRPGLLLVTRGTAWADDAFATARRLAEASGRSASPVGLDDLLVLDAFMAARGVDVRILPPVPNSRRGSVGDAIDGFEQGLWSWSWDVPEENRREAAAAVRAWAGEHEPLGLDTPLPPLDIVWRAYDL